MFSIFHAMPMPAVVLRTDADFTIAEVNDLFLENARRSREELLGKGLFDIFHGEDASAMAESFIRVAKSGEAERLPYYRFDIPGPEGQGFVKRYWSPNNIPVPDHTGQIRFILHAVSDITAEIELREVHRKNKQEFQSLFEQHPDVVFSLDLNGYFTRVNQAAVQLSERTEAELLSMHFSELSLVSESSRLEGYFRECCAGASFSVEVPAISKSGKRHELNISVMPLLIDGEVRGVYGIAKDETERYRFQQERQLISQVSQLFNQSDDLSDCLSAVLKELCGLTGTVVAEAWTGSVGHTEVVRLASVHLARKFRPDGKGMFEQPDGLIGLAWDSREIVQMTDLPNNPVFRRTAFAADNGLLSGIAMPILSNGQVVAVFSFYSDLSLPIPAEWMSDGLMSHLAGEIQRKKAEQELNQFFNLSPDMLAIVGFDGYFKKINAMFTRLLGYSEEELTSRPFFDFIHPDDRAASEAALRHLKSNLLTQSFENRYITKAGERKWISWAANISKDDRLLYAVARDVTEKKELEKTVQQEQLRFSRMFNEAPVSMCILKGRDHVYTHVNAAFYAFTGKSGIEGKSVLEAFPEVENQGIPEWMNHVYETGETFTSADTPLELVRDGKLEPCYLTFMYQPYKNNEGAVEGIFYFGIDVTEQVLARKRLEDSERRYVDLIENLPVAVYTTDAKGNMLLYNRAAVELWGTRPELGREYQHESIQIFTPEGRPLPHDRRPLASALINGKPAWNAEVVLKRPDGELRNVLACPSPVYDADGALYGGINVLIDITERKQAEEEIQRLSLIARDTDNAVIITDLDGRIEWVNDAFSKMTEYSFREAAGRSEAAFLHGEHTDPSVVAQMEDMNSKGQVFQCEVLNYTKSGRPFWREVMRQPLFNRNGNVTNYMSISRDVTERKEAYQKLVQSRKEIQSFARQLNDVLEDERAHIAREIHDEFGQQLAGLKMYLNSLRGYLAEGGEAVLDSTMAAADVTIQSLRKFATELRPGILDTLGLIPSLEWLIEDFKAKLGVSCRIRLKGEKRRNIEKNISICCFRICQEALTNIIKHADASRVTAELEITPDRLFMRIADNGRGMLPDSIQNPFSMGLLGMRERAALVGGNLLIKSRPGKGTTLDLVIGMRNDRQDPLTE